MKTRFLNNVKIVSTGHYVPSGVLSNEDLEKIVDTSDEWIYSRTGIKTRRIANGEKTSDMAYLAALDAINKAGYEASRIDLILVATCTGDYRAPSVACRVQALLGLSERDVACFDVNAACSGFVYASSVASQMLNGGRYSSALVIGAETLSLYTDYEDRGTCVLFGDGAGAMILESTNEYKPADFYLSAKGELDLSIVINDKIAMDGRKIYQFAVRVFEESIQKIMLDNGLGKEDIAVIIPHQANLRIIEKAAELLNIDIEKFYINIEKYGNTSAASIPFAFDEYMSAAPRQENKKVIFVGFGAGLTWGAAMLTL